uniref:Uncharacterized protein n=1 Tax=Arundo donax TaxID=35708 RepID=A0A0A9G981_ARUDO
MLPKQSSQGAKWPESFPWKSWLYTLHLREGDPDGVPLKRAGVFRHEGLSRLFFSLKLDESLPLAVHLEQLSVDNRAMFGHMVKDCVLGYLLWESRDVDHLGWSTAVPVVLDHIAVKPVQA